MCILYTEIRIGIAIYNKPVGDCHGNIGQSKSLQTVVICAKIAYMRALNNAIYTSYTVQDDLLAREIFGDLA